MRENIVSEDFYPVKISDDDIIKTAVGAVSSRFFITLDEAKRRISKAINAPKADAENSKIEYVPVHINVREHGFVFLYDEGDL